MATLAAGQAEAQTVPWTTSCSLQRSSIVSRWTTPSAAFARLLPNRVFHGPQNKFGALLWPDDVGVGEFEVPRHPLWASSQRGGAPAGL